MLTQHALSAAFPSMSLADLAALTEDIKENGQRHPIIMLDGQILDGWHRYQACLAAGVEACCMAFEDVHPFGDPAAFVLSSNLKRRHLSASQRAAAVAAVAEWAPVGAPSNVAAAATLKPTTIEKAAKAADVSPRTIRHAKVAQAAGLGPAVRDGKISAEQGAKIAKLPEPERAAAVEAGHAPKEEEEEYTEADANADMEADALAHMEEAMAIIQADDKLAGALKEVVKAKAISKTYSVRQESIMRDLATMTGEAKRWMRKAEKLEKCAKACTCGAMGAAK